jgi:hypothetical protein
MHICVAPLQGTHDGSVCNHLFKLSKDKRKSKSSWITSKATHHLARCHSTLEYGKVYTAKDSSAAGKKISTMFSHSHGRGPRKAAHNFDNYVANTTDTCKSSMAVWYVYGNQRISKRTFEDKYFREMMESCHFSGAATVERIGSHPPPKPTKAPILTAKILKSWVRAEFDIFLIFLKFMMNLKYNHSRGNKFGQCLHDGGTLDNGKKYQAMSLQFVDPEWSRNFVVAVGFARCKDGKASKVFQLFKRLTYEQTGIEPSQIWGSCVADGAAQKIVAISFVEGKVCLMHNGDKVGASAVGELTRTQMKAVINPFPTGKALILKAHKLATHFLYGTTRYEHLWKISNASCNGAMGDWVKISLDLNGTRISAQQSLL